MFKLRLALDWTPNTNHTGFYVAQGKGWYQAEGLDVEIFPPSEAYSESETPARKVVNGLAELCVAPTESVISCWTSDGDRVRPVVVAALLQDDTSAVVTLESSSMTKPSDLDGKLYASYGGRFEMAIIRQLVKQTGGKGEVNEVLPPKLDCFDVVLRGDADATWVFMGWEGKIAEQKGVKLRPWFLKDYNVPYGYSPCLLAHPDLLNDEYKAAYLKKFLHATERGYQYATMHPEESIQHLMEVSNYHPSLLQLNNDDVLLSSQQFLSSSNCYLNSDNKWGLMDSNRWSLFLDWLCDNELITYRNGQVVSRDSLVDSDLYTNKFLDS